MCVYLMLYKIVPIQCLRRIYTRSATWYTREVHLSPRTQAMLRHINVNSNSSCSSLASDSEDARSVGCLLDEASLSANELSDDCSSFGAVRGTSGTSHTFSTCMSSVKTGPNQTVLQYCHSDSSIVGICDCDLPLNDKQPYDSITEKFDKLSLEKSCLHCASNVPSVSKLTESIDASENQCQTGNNQVAIPCILTDECYNANFGLMDLQSFSSESERDLSLHRGAKPDPPPRPHHYISSLRVASMRGSVDLGGALVCRVGAFLRTLYKSYMTSPVHLPWCSHYWMVISDYDTCLMPVPFPTSHSLNGRIPSLIRLNEILQHKVPQASCMDSTVEGRVTKVAISADIGFAKSVLALKMAYDWAIGSGDSYLSSFSLVYVISVRDMRGVSMFTYMCKEILPKHILSKGAMSTFWECMAKIDDKILFLLIDCDETDESNDLRDLIEGRLFPSSTVVLVASQEVIRGLPTATYKHFLMAGFDGVQARMFLSSFFVATRGRGDCVSEVDSLVHHFQDRYPDQFLCPIMCIILGVLSEDAGGRLPPLRITDLVWALIKHAVRQHLVRRGEPMCYDTLPEKYALLMKEFGKLCLDCLRRNSSNFTIHDLKSKCTNGLELIDIGLLVCQPSLSKLNKKDHFIPVHRILLEFMAASYLCGQLNCLSVLHSELDSLVETLELSYSLNRPSVALKVLRFLTGLLVRNSFLVFHMLSQMGVSQWVMFWLLKESGMSEMNVIEVCKHVSSRDHMIIATNSPELEDWGRLLYSPDCTLEEVEVRLDLDTAARDAHESFFTLVSFNESVKVVRLTCVIAGEFGDAQVSQLISYVRAVLTKRRLESFEIRVTNIEESVPVCLAPVVEMICDTVPHLSPCLTRMVMALDLDSRQVMRLCDVLREARSIEVLHLPHLTCDSEGFSAIGNILSQSHLASLSLTGAVSFQNSLNSNSALSDDSPWQFTDTQSTARSVFHSLPPSFYHSLPQRGGSERYSKGRVKWRAASGLLNKMAFSLPACSPENHLSGFHQLFTSVRNATCHLTHLNVSKCSLSPEDLICLGESVRLSKCLSSLHMEGASRMVELFPLLVSLQDNTSLQLLDLSSPHILLSDTAFQFTLRTLSKNSSLRFLVLSNWTFQLESERSLQDLISFINKSEIQHLNLSGTKVLLTLPEISPMSRLNRHDDLPSALLQVVPAFCNNNLLFLNLDLMQVTLNNSTILRGPQLSLLVRHFCKLVNVSLVSDMGSEVLEESAAISLFSGLRNSWPFLRSLNIAGWRFRSDNCAKTAKVIGKSLRGSQLREVHLLNVEMRDASGKGDQVHLLVASLAMHLHHLSLLSLENLPISESQAQVLGKTLSDKMASASVFIETRGMSYSAVRNLRLSFVEKGRWSVTFMGGVSMTYLMKRLNGRDNSLAKWVCLPSSSEGMDEV